MRSRLPAAIAGVAMAALLVRCLSIAEPLGIDQSLWASAVRGMSRGQLLYRDVWEQRPPGIYWIYLAGFNLFGWTPAAVAWLDILASTATTTFLYAIGRRLATPLTGACAAALYALLTMPAWLYGHGGFLERSICETFFIVCVASSAWCAVRFRERGATAFAFGVGLFGGAAVVLKPNAGLYCPALLAWMLLARQGVSPVTGRDLIRSLATAAFAGLLVPAVAIMWFGRLGLLHDARVAVVDFNRFYVAQGFAPASYALEFSRAIWLRIKSDPLWLGGTIAAVVGVWDAVRTRRIPPLPGLTIFWGAAGAIVMIVNGARLFNSYFMPVFPPLALLTAWLLTESVRASMGRRLIAAMVAVLMSILLVKHHYPAKVLDSALSDGAMLRGYMDRSVYLDRFGGYGNARGYSARANAELAAYVREHTTPDERIFLFGISGAGVYFAADRLTAHRFLRVNFFVDTDFPDPAFRLPAVTAELAVRRPRYLIFERLNSDSPMARAVDRLTENPDVLRLLSAYRLDTRIEDFTLYRRVD